MRSKSFAPVAGQQPRVLVLGSMPGQASLSAQQYYAHPRNAFWPIAMSVCQATAPDYGSAHALPYEDRIELLHLHHIALWDVLAECERPGSLDSSIQRSTAAANPITQWLQEQPSIERVCFNGKAAAALFKRHWVRKNSPDETAVANHIEFHTLPSTSPAMASMNLVQKASVWRPKLMA